MRILMIYNPVSGLSGSRGTRIGNALFRLGENDGDVVVYQTKSKDDGAEYLAKHSDEKYDMIVVSGGDGTLHEIVNAVMKLGIDSKIGYLPSGSTNDYAKNLGITQRNSVENLFNPKIRELDLGLFNGEYFTYVAAFGLCTDIPYSTPQSLKNSMGYLAYLLEGAKELTDMKPIRIKCKTDKELIEDTFVVGLITNALCVGGMKRRDSETKLDDGLMEYVFIKFPQNIIDVRNIVFRLLNSMFDEKYMYYGSSSSFVIDSEEMTWTLDGESSGQATSHTEIKTCRKALKIAVGKGRNE